MSPLSSGVCFCIYSSLIPSNFMALLNSFEIYWGPLSVLSTRSSGTVPLNAMRTAFSTDRMVSLPFPGECVLYAHQIGHSRLSWNVGDVSLPELIRSMRMEEIPDLCSTPVLRCRKVLKDKNLNLPDGLLIHRCSLIPEYYPHSPVSVCWPL